MKIGDKVKYNGEVKSLNDKEGKIIFVGEHEYKYIVFFDIHLDDFDLTEQSRVFKAKENLLKALLIIMT